MLNNDKQEILDKTYIYNKYRDASKKDKFRKSKVTCFFISLIFSLIIICILYLISPYSKTKKIIVTGNHYLKEEDIIKEANLNSHFLLTMPKTTSKRLMNNTLINEASIEMLEDSVVAITVKEVKAIGYIFEDNESKLLLINDERIVLNKDNMYLIDKVPLIEGYTKDELKEVERGFEELDYSIINEISEIHKYPISYDETQMEVIMRDGNYCFMSCSSLKLLDSYYSISSSIDEDKGHVCVYMDVLTNSAYVSTCPWQVVEEVKDEETDETLEVEKIEEN